MGHIYAFMTGTRSDFTDHRKDSHGWVDPPDDPGLRTYQVYFVRKSRGSEGRTEKPSHRRRDGGVWL